jgi:hypothetical protein
MVAEQQQPAFDAPRQPDSDDGGHPLRSNQFDVGKRLQWPKAAVAPCPDTGRSPRCESRFFTSFALVSSLTDLLPTMANSAGSPLTPTRLSYKYLK